MDAFGRTDRNPRDSPGPGLVFSLPGFDPGETVSVSYAARVGSTASLGRQVNRALAFAYVDLGRKRLLSPIDRAEVVVEASRVFREEGAVVGKVFLDCDADGVQTPGGGLGEAGVQGVRIVFENGVSATTDEFGRYSVYSFDPVTHVARIDPTTLPAGARPRLTDNRQVLDARSRFVDLRKGELHRADFALDPCTDAVRGEAAARAEALGANRSLATLFDRKFALAPRAPPPPAHTRRAVSSPPPAKRTPESRAVAVWPTVKMLPATRNLTAEIQSFDNTIDFVDLADGRTPVPVGAEGATFDLIPPEVAGSRTVTVESSFHAVEKTIVFLPDLRPMIAVGVVEGAFGAGAGGGVAIWSARGT